MSSSERMHVLVAGGGVAAVEAVLALDAAAGDRVRITMLTPVDRLEVRALAVATPFAHGHERRRFPLAPLLQQVGGELVVDGLAEVLGDQRTVVTTGGATIVYDALIVAVGGRPRPAFPGVLTFGAEPLLLSGLLADIEEGYSRRVAFIVPAGISWPLPAYELALMTRRQATAMSMEPEIAVVTPETAPLAVFGRAASAKVAELLAEAGITVHTGAQATVGPSGRIGLLPSHETLEPQRIVALPLIEGPRIEGLPHDQDGFVPIDQHARVPDVDAVYCVGDAANYPIKQGGLATQQADTAALHIAARAGADVVATPFSPVLRGRLMTGGAEQFFVKPVGRIGGEQSPQPLWWPPTKVSGRYVTPWIAAQDPGLVPPQPAEHSEAVDQPIPVHPDAARRAILSLSPLGGPPPVHRGG